MHRVHGGTTLRLKRPRRIRSLDCIRKRGLSCFVENSFLTLDMPSSKVPRTVF
jgi:hypothetical protein